jgi:hypothetical protein
MRYTDIQRMDWVKGNKQLASWHRQSRLTLREFVAQNRDEIDHAINCLVDSRGCMTDDLLATI